MVFVLLTQHVSQNTMTKKFELSVSGTTSQMHIREDITAFDLTLEKSEYQLIENLL
jgi:hypothetical protein